MVLQLTQNGDAVLRTEPQFNESLGHGHDVSLVLGIAPLHPGAAPLHRQGRGVRRPGQSGVSISSRDHISANHSSPGHGLLQHRPQGLGRDIGAAGAVQPEPHWLIRSGRHKLGEGVRDAVCIKR